MVFLFRVPPFSVIFRQSKFGTDAVRVRFTHIVARDVRVVSVEQKGNEMRMVPTNESIAGKREPKSALTLRAQHQQPVKTKGLTMLVKKHSYCFVHLFERVLTHPNLEAVGVGAGCCDAVANLGNRSSQSLHHFQTIQNSFSVGIVHAICFHKVNAWVILQRGEL